MDLLNNRNGISDIVLVALFNNITSVAVTSKT